MKRRNTC